MGKWALPKVTVERERQQVPKIEVRCMEYAIIFPNENNMPSNRSTKNASRRSKSKSRSRTPGPVAVAESKVDTKDRKEVQYAPVQVSPSVPRRSARKGSFGKYKSEALGPLNTIQEFASPRPRGTTGLVASKPQPSKRKRIVEDQEIAAENIPLEKVLPTLQFGVNKDLSPKKRRRLQSLICPTNPK